MNHLIGFFFGLLSIFGDRGVNLWDNHLQHVCVCVCALTVHTRSLCVRIKQIIKAFLVSFVVRLSTLLFYCSHDFDKAHLIFIWKEPFHTHEPTTTVRKSENLIYYSFIFLLSFGSISAEFVFMILFFLVWKTSTHGPENQKPLVHDIFVWLNGQSRPLCYLASLRIWVFFLLLLNERNMIPMDRTFCSLPLSLMRAARIATCMHMWCDNKTTFEITLRPEYEKLFIVYHVKYCILFLSFVILSSRLRYVYGFCCERRRHGNHLLCTLFNNGHLY